MQQQNMQRLFCKLLQEEIRTNLIDEPIKRPIKLNKPLKSANFKHFKDD